METVILLLESLLYFSCIYGVLKNLYGYNISDKKYVCYILIGYIICLCIPFPQNQVTYDLISVLALTANLIVLKTTFKESKWYSIIAIFISLYFITIIISSITLFTINKFSHLSIVRFIGFLSTAVVLILSSILCATVREYIQPIFMLIPSKIKILTLLSIISSTFVISATMGYSTANAISSWTTPVRIMIVILTLIIGSVFPVLISTSIGKSFYNKQSKAFEAQIEIQAKHYEELAKNNFELRRFKHDYKNMLIGVQKLIESGDTDAALELLNSKSKLVASSNLQSYYDTGNGIVDAILTEKQETANIANASIVFEGAIPTDKIAPTDLCIMFGNTLDNAIEACEKLQNGTLNTISVVCKSAGGFLFVNISNPTASDNSFNPKRVQTSKQDKINHGFGLYSLRKSIAKYDGTLNFNCNDNLFSVELELNLSA